MANRLLIKTIQKPTVVSATGRRLNSATTPPLIAALTESHASASPPPSSSAILDFRTRTDDAPRIFSSVSTSKLIRSSLNLHLAAIEPMVDLGMWMMRSKLMEVPGIRDVVMEVVRHTFFEHFCAGESVEETGRCVEKLWRSGLRGMLCYGLENADDNDSCDRNFQAFLHTIRSASSLPPSSVSSIVVKITAICRISLLRKVSDFLRWEHNDPSCKLPWKRETLPILSDSSPFYHTLERPEPLTAEEELDLELGHERLEKLCQACLEANLPLVIDAEDTFLQPSVDYFTYSSAIKCRKDGKVVLYGTIQAYLKDAGERLHLVHSAAKKMGVPLGFKMVRGAYMSSERKLAQALDVESPIHDTIQDTHNCYNDCVNFLLEKISEGCGSNLVLATHNLESGKLAATKANELGIKRDSDQVQFAQLYGMSDALSFGLRNAGFNVSKYMPFGPIDKIIPYLLRRAEENRGLLSSSILDRQLMREELKKRLKSAFV
ncbi:unnamed protein product [Rhodiola kirilowii]